MPLVTLALDDLRCIARAELDLSAGVNLIWGPNGAGKTSVLEGIFLLGRGRSFRTRNSDRLIRLGSNALVSFGRVEGSPGNPAAAARGVGVRVSREAATEAKVDGEFVGSLAELSTVLPVQIIDPGIHRLVEEGPSRRRRWLDWAVFHVEHDFMGHWLRYQRALRQRNAALRRPGLDLGAWNHELVREGEPLSEARRRLIERLHAGWDESAGEFSGAAVRLGYFRGWSEEVSLLQALEAGEARDRERGTTFAGPHRADVTLRIAGRAAREVLSRGQQKLIAIALTLAQLDLLRGELGIRPMLLLDDPQAELDADRLRDFLRRVRELGCQVVVTSLQPEIPLLGPVERVFHVERGRVERR